jgi:parvulin-like peptidyl-prolyl isomerase
MSIALSGIASGLTQAAQNIASGVSSAASTVAAGANAAAANVTQSVHGGHHHHHGGGGGGGGQLFQKIQQSVLSALQAQSQNQTPGSVSANQTVQSAIGQVLQARFSSANGPTATTPPQESDENGDTDVDSTSVQQFFQQLQSYGVTPEQFRQDFRSAMQQTGQSSNPSQITAIPLGLLVNLLA